MRTLRPWRRPAWAILAAILLLAGCRSGAREALEEPPPERAEAPAPSPDPRRFTMVAAGDVLIHEGLAIRASRNAGGGGNAFGGSYDFRPMFDRVRPILSAADLAVCHMETPISKDNARLSYYPRFWVPREVGAAVAHAGFHVCTTASNHSIDRGSEGLVTTLEVLDAEGVGHSGTGRTPEEARRPAVFRLRGMDVALLSYTYGLNGLTLPADRSWMVNLIDTELILTDARAAREAGAAFVSVSLHWGTEYRHEPNEQQRTLADALLNSGVVDLILGHHAHVVQPIARVGDKVVVFGMGNFISRQSAHCCPAATQDGVIVHLVVEEVPGGGAAVREVRYTPTWVEPSTFRVLPVAPALDDPETPSGHREGLRASWARTLRAIDSMGASQWGVAPTSTPSGP